MAVALAAPATAAEKAELLVDAAKAGARIDRNIFRLDAIAAKDRTGKLWLAMTHLDPNQPAELEVSLANLAARSAVAETLTAASVDSVNTFDAPRTVAPRSVPVKLQGGKLALRLEPKSVTVVSVGP